MTARPNRHQFRRRPSARRRPCPRCCQGPACRAGQGRAGQGRAAMQQTAPMPGVGASPNTLVTGGRQALARAIRDRLDDSSLGLR